MEDKRLIETRLPIGDISGEAKKEKSGWARPPTSELLFWWTRKPLIVSRAAVLGALLPKEYNDKTFRLQMGLGREKRSYLYTPNAKRLEDFYFSITGRKHPRLLDPFAGGGSIPFESFRAGIDTVALEYNPVAYIILQATLNYPKKYGNKLAEDVMKLGKEVLERTRKEIGHLYPCRNKWVPLVYIWAWMVKCDRCGQKSPLMLHWRLTVKKRMGLRPVLLDNLDFDVEFTKHPPKGTVERGKSLCLKCGAPISKAAIRKEVSAGHKRMLCIGLTQRTHIKFEKPTEKDIEMFTESEKKLKEMWSEYDKMGLIPTEEMQEYELYQLTRYGFTKWYHLFNPRQLLTLLTLSKNIIKIAGEIEKKEGCGYAQAVTTYLGLTLCRHAQYNSICTTWPAGVAKESISHTLSFRRPSMTWNHAEANPFGHGSGTWISMLEGVVRAIQFATKYLSPTEGTVEIHLGSALRLPFKKEEFDVIVTDPPYLDDVPYGELSEFYHVWLWRIVKRYYPKLPGPKVPVDEELDHSPGRHGSAELSREFYMSGLTESFRQMRRVLADDGLMVLFFAHSKRKAWSILISSLVNSDFRVTMTWPVRTESPTNIVQRGRASMQSSILVAARKRMGGGTAFLEDLRDEVADHVRKGLEAISDLNLIGADLIVAGMGKALEVTTRYSELKSYSGNATLESMLEVVSGAVFSYSIEKLVRRPLATLDPQTAFYVFAKCSYGGVIPSDDALMLCKGAGVELAALERDKVIAKKKVGARVVLSALNADERDLDPERPPRTPSIIDQLHLLELAVKKQGKTGFQRLLSSPKFRLGEVRAVAEALYNGLLTVKKDDPEVALLRPLIDLFRSTISQPTGLEKYLS